MVRISLSTAGISRIWLGVGLASLSLAIGSVVLTSLMSLHPCPLCIFQRFLFLNLGVLGLAAYAARGYLRAGLGAASLFVSGWGAGVAGYQSWLEIQPPGTASCSMGDPGFIEQVSEWLGTLSTDLFLVTGFCEDPELFIGGLSLANWALLCFVSICGLIVSTYVSRNGGYTANQK